MELPKNLLNFRNNNADCLYIILLPLIGLLNSLKSNYDGPWNELSLYLYINTFVVLLCYRYSTNLLIFSFINIFVIVLAYFGNLSNCHLLVLFVNPLYLLIFQVVPSKFTRCFTFAEFLITSQCFMIYSFKLLIFNLQHSGIQLIDVYQDESELFCLISYTTLLFSFILIYLTNSISSQIFGFFVFFPLSLYYYLNLGLSKEPITWLIQYIFGNQRRVELFTIWLTILTMTFIFVLIHTYFSKKCTTTVTRKIFHISISVVFLIGIKYDAAFLEFSSKLVLLVFIFVEVVRICKIERISLCIDRIFERFRDEKDSGILTLSHIYLLVGCSLPLWLSKSFDSQMLLSSGIISIGIGDAFASLGGFYLGKYKWPNSSKTLEGTFCSFLSQIIAFYLIDAYFKQNILISTPLLSYAKVCLISLLSSLFETFTSHVDNLILPFVQYILILIFFYL